MPIGLTKSAGYEMGIRRTFPITEEEMWKKLFTTEWMTCWLGKAKGFEMRKGEVYKTVEGVEGKVHVFIPNSHFRITWKRKGWKNESLLQVRILRAKSGTTISFHQEKLADGQQRDEMLNYWKKVLDRLEKKIDAK